MLSDHAPAMHGGDDSWRPFGRTRVHAIRGHRRERGGYSTRWLSVMGWCCGNCPKCLLALVARSLVGPARPGNLRRDSLFVSSATKAVWTGGGRLGALGATRHVRKDSRGTGGTVSS